jgi:hypothetical protein
MKSFRNALLLGALALVGIGTPALAEDATTHLDSVTLPHPVRCLVCGASNDVVVTVGRENTLEVKLQRSPATGNPRGN